MNIMRKIFLTFLLVAFASAAFAEGTPKKPSVAGFVSNGFWDNWEISAGFGTGTAFSNGGNSGSWGDRFGFEGNLSVTKWVHPVFGMRAQLQGGWFNNFDSQIGKMTFKVIGAAAFPAEHSIVNSIGARRPNKADLKEASEYGISLNRIIKKEDSFASFDLKVPGNTPYRKYGKNVLFPKADVSLCTECSACAKICPAGAISLDNPKKTDHDKCIGCMKCVRS